MDDATCSEAEAQWRQQRRELFEDLYQGGKKPLNREAVLSTRKHFTTGATFEPKPYVFPNDDDCVALICAPIPDEMAKRCHAIGQRLVELLPREPETNDAVAYVNRLDLMHVTLFHTSHPDELAPHAQQRRAEDVAQLKQLGKRFAPFRMAPVKVILASSGAIIMLFQCLPDVNADASVVNANAEFSVDHLRRVAKEEFEHVPKKGARTIIHSTLARVLSPDVSDDALDRVRAMCEEISSQLAADPQPALFDKLWYVEETHHFSPQGAKTDIPLVGGQQ